MVHQAIPFLASHEPAAREPAACSLLPIHRPPPTQGHQAGRFRQNHHNRCNSTHRSYQITLGMIEGRRKIPRIALLLQKRR
jgi:hypothetical protein